MNDRKFLETSSGLGRRLIRLREKESPASKEFLYMGREVNSFHATYQILRPHIHSSARFISDAGRILVRRIFDGIQTNCDCINSSLRALDERLQGVPRKSKQSLFGFSTNGRNKVFKKFLERNDYELERCQIRFGELLLKVVLAVLVYAQNIHDTVSTPNFTDESRFLIKGLNKAWERLQKLERDHLQAKGRNKRPIRVEARWWWDDLPPQQDGVAMNPLERLAELWVNYDARLASRPTPNEQAFLDRIQQWVERSDRFEENSRRLADDNRQLQAQRQQLTTANLELATDNQHLETQQANYQRTIARLRREVDRLNGVVQQRDEALAAESAARRREALQVDDLRAELNNIHPRSRESREPSSRHYENERLPRNPARGTSGRTLRDHSPPPAAMDNRRHHHRRSSSSSNGTRRSSGSSTLNVYAGSSSSSVPPPPVPYHTRPFPTELEGHSSSYRDR